MMLKAKIKEIIISEKETILNSLKKMDESSRRLLLVFHNDKYVNILSIGDIQRAIIKNITLDTEVSKILRKETRVCRSHESFESIKNKMLKFRIECMPVLDENDHLVDAYFWEDVFPNEEKRIKRKLNLPVIIMAGGKGLRLKPLTNVLPKPLIPLGDKTIIEEILDRFGSYGCNKFYISVNYKAELIKYYLSSQKLNYQLTYVNEKKPLGTAGSLSLLKGKIDQTFFVTNCDILIDQDYAEILDYHYENKNMITIVAALKHYPIPYGTLETGDKGLLKSLSEKPELTFKINSGMYILEPSLLNDIPENIFFHITELIDIIRKRNEKVGVFPVSEKSWKDIGNWQEYFKTIVL